MEKYVEAIIKKNNNYYMNNELLPVAEVLKSNYIELLKYKLLIDNIGDFKIETTEVISSINPDIIIRILVKEQELEKIQKEIYLFTIISCSKEINSKINKEYFQNINELLDYSNKLRNKYKEYHLISFRDYPGINLTFDNFDINEIENEYNSKIKKLR